MLSRTVSELVRENVSATLELIQRETCFKDVYKLRCSRSGMFADDNDRIFLELSFVFERESVKINIVEEISA